MPLEEEHLVEAIQGIAYIAPHIIRANDQHSNLHSSANFFLDVMQNSPIRAIRGWCTFIANDRIATGTSSEGIAVAHCLKVQ